MLLQDKARIRWANQGERNTAYYHGLLKASHSLRSPHFKLTSEQGTTITDQATIQRAALDFYSDLFSSPGYPDFNTALDCIPSLITSDMNVALCSIPQEPEILEAVKGLSPYSAPGPDGFTGFFFIHCWEIINTDVVSAIQDFFRGGQIPSPVASTLLILLPKIPNPSNLKDLRPVSLCNFVHKIISKVLASKP